MLKIKDNVNLKELEKYGFEHFSIIYKSNENMPNKNHWCYVLKFIDIDKELQVLLLQINDDRQI